jgi:hypothetical protein
MVKLNWWSVLFALSPVSVVGLYTFVKGQEDREFSVRSGHGEEDKCATPGSRTQVFSL